jgi:hypothetical protein
MDRRSIAVIVAVVLLLLYAVSSGTQPRDALAGEDRQSRYRRETHTGSRRHKHSGQQQSDPLTAMPESAAVGRVAEPSWQVDDAMLDVASKSDAPWLLPDAFGCATVLRDVAFNGGELQAAGYKGPRPKLNLCPIDVMTPVPVRVTKATPTQRKCHPIGFAAVIYRPQHAMQCFFSVVGAFALMRRAGLDPATTPIRLAVMRYGAIGTWADLDARKFPHVEMLQTAFGKQTRIFTLAEWAPHLLAPPRDLLAPSGECFRAVVFGSLPQRIAGPAGVLPLTGLNESHFAAFRQHMLRVVGGAPSPVGAGHVLVVQRQTPGRRLVNIDAIRLAICEGTGMCGEAVRVVSWEGMPFAQQVALAAGARGMVGAHGNGLAWHCLMPPGAFVVELTSRIRQRNEVVPGEGVINSGNIGRLCGLRTISVACAYEENAASKDASRTAPHRAWKEVDLVFGPEQHRDVVAFLRAPPAASL